MRRLSRSWFISLVTLAALACGSEPSVGAAGINPSAVTKIVAGSNITIDHGTGVVTISSSGGGGSGGPVSSLVLGASTFASSTLAQVMSNGVLALNFPAGTTAAALELPGTINHETAMISALGPDAQGPKSTLLSQFRNNSAAVPTYLGGLFWEYSDVSVSKTAGSENTQFGLEVMSAGAPITAFRLAGSTLSNGVQALFPTGYNLAGAIHPGIAFLNDRLTGLYGVTGSAGTTDMYLMISSSPTASFIGWRTTTLNATTGSVDIDFHVGGDASSLTVGPNRSGLYGDVVNGNIYLHAVVRQVDIGSPGALATSATADFLGMATMPGAPTAAPGGASTGKTYLVYDSTNIGMWARASGTTYNFLPTVSAVANGSTAVTVTSLGPAAASTTIQRWMKTPDGAGSYYLTPSYH